MDKRKAAARTPEQKQKLYDDIIAKGRKLFVEKGSEGFSLRLLAKELGMTHGNIYNYISSKRELWIEIRRNDLQILKAGFADIINRIQGSYFDKVEAIVLYYLNYAQKEYRSFQILFNIPVPHSEKPMGKIEKNYVPLRPHEILIDLIRKGVESGEFVKKNPEYLSYVMFSTMHGATTMELEFRMKSNILEPMGSLLKDNGLEEFRKEIIESLKRLLVAEK